MSTLDYARRPGWRFHLHQSSCSRVVEDSLPVVEPHACDFKQALALTIRRSAFNTTLQGAPETGRITSNTSGEPPPLMLALAYRVPDATRLAYGLEGYSAAAPSLHTTNKAATLREPEQRGGSSVLKTLRFDIVAHRSRHSSLPLRETFSTTCQKN